MRSIPNATVKIYIEQFYRDMKCEMSLDLNIVTGSQRVNSKGYFFTMETSTMLTIAGLLQSSNKSLKHLENVNNF